MNMLISSLKGTRDFYPEEMLSHLWLYEKIREISESFGYEAYEGPFLEKIELYAAKSGDELVKEQAFCFEDRGGDLITLRPELTPTLARMVAKRQRQLFMPLRWYSFGNFWRYERPQRGRTREFYQWNMDMIGANSPETDAELVAVCAAFFKRVRLGPDVIKIKLNNRRLMDRKLGELDIPDDQRSMIFKLIDRRPRMKPDAWVQHAEQQGLSADKIAGLDLLLKNGNLWEESDELKRTMEVLKMMGWSDYIEYDASTIRGLDYYTGLVFEAIEVTGGRAILGGGHYDNLVGDVGGDPLPGVGFAMGDVLIKIILKEHDLLPDFQKSNKKVVMVTVFDKDLQLESIRLASELRQAGIQTAIYPEPVKLAKQFKYADRKGMNYAIVMGPDEISQNVVSVKDLKTRQQETFDRSDLLLRLKRMLA